MITFLGLICDSRHLSIRSKSVDLTSNLSSKIPSREEANTANLDIQVISDCNQRYLETSKKDHGVPYYTDKWSKNDVFCF